MVVSSVRDYLRKLSEAAEKVPLSPSIRDGSTVRALTESGFTCHILMFILARSGYLTPPSVNYIGRHNSKRHMNQRGCPESVQLFTINE
jgi:hypothetical protein